METTKRGGNALLLLAVIGGLFLALLDQTIVGTALPQITVELGGAGLYTWVVTAYLLTSTITVPLYGGLSDIYGRKPLLLIGIATFLAGSALCGLAQDMPQLIAFRAIQGLGAGALLPLTLALFLDLVPRERTGQVQGAIGGVMALSYLAGPFLGGVFADQLSWRWAFYVNVPIGLVLMAVIAVRLPHRPGRGRGVRPDHLGIAVLSAAITALLVGLAGVGEGGSGWTDVMVLGPLALGVVLLALFAAVERRAATPIMPLHLFRNRTYTIVNITSFFAAFAMYAGVVFLPRYFQEAYGLSATAAGLYLYPLLAGMLVSSYLVGVVIGRTGAYKPWLIAATALTAAGTLLCAWLGLDTPTWQLVVMMTVLGLGLGPMTPALTVALQSAVDPRYIGTASSNLTFFRQIGGSLALAVAGTAYAAVLAAQAPAAGMAAAHAAASATVIPLLGVAGAAICLVALLALPGRPPAAPGAAAPSGEPAARAEVAAG